MMDYRHFTILKRTSLFLFILLFAGNVKGEPVSEVHSSPLQMGSYLTVEYINLLKQTKSPIYAGDHTDRRQLIETALDDKQNQIFFQMGNFHDSDGIYKSDLTLKKLINTYDKSAVKVKIKSRTEFIISVKGKSLHYRYIGNIKQFLIRNTIVGKFVDHEGNFYSFTEDGLATFPDRSFQFKIDPDYVFIGFDRFIEDPIKDKIYHYGYKLTNNELQLFNINDEDARDATPFVKLIRVAESEVKP